MYKKIRAVLSLLLVLFLAASAKSGGDLRNANCFYGADGNLIHAQVVSGPDGNYTKAECAPSFAEIFERPLVKTYTRAEWEHLLINKGRGPAFVVYSQENDREPSMGGSGSWWADDYNERQGRDHYQAGTNRINSETELNNAISNQINHPGGLNNFHPSESNVNVRIR